MKMEEVVEQIQLFSDLKPSLPEKLSYLAISVYAKQYVAWRSEEISKDLDNKGIHKELDDINKIADFIKATYNKTFSIIEIVAILYHMAKFSPDTEGRAKNVFLCSVR
jgi:hypothetical protein